MEKGITNETIANPKMNIK